jgi:hypothetical protein
VAGVVDEEALVDEVGALTRRALVDEAGVIVDAGVA